MKSIGTDRKLFFFICLALLLCPASSVPEGNRIVAGQFSSGGLGGWQEKKFRGETRYIPVNVDGLNALKAQSDKSASGLVKKIDIDLRVYPYLNWRWRVDKKPDGNYDETLKTGDDYAARVYVIHSGGMAIWNTKALNYVWAKHSAKASVWDNAYAGSRSVMIAARSSEDPEGVWVSEKYNIREDFKKYCGEDIQTISAVAIMTDADDTGSSAEAFYGDIFFSIN